MINIKELHKKFVLPTYAPGLLFVKGSGTWLWDETGKKYLDFASGIAVCSLGHCHPAITEAIKAQSEKLVHISNLYYNENQPQLAEQLIKKSYAGKVFFANSGAEANEGMIKLARKNGSESNKNEIIVMEESFHGRTLATLSATGRSKYREGFAPDMPGFHHVPFNDIKALENAITEKTCAILIEPIQGEGGVYPATREFLSQARELCDKHNLLLMFDEVQSGMGRTGEYFAWQKYGVEPDVFSLAKALGNGFPIGAFVVKDKYKDVLGVGSHASTFGGTPLACAAALAVIKTIDKENILDNCNKQSKKIITGLNKLKEKYSMIEEIRGSGLMLGAVLNRDASGIRKTAEELGLLVLTAGEKVLRLLPPLNVKDEEIDIALNILDTAFAANEKH
jgi:predicted acetylornithine/succinylornithine family transaminase